MTLYKFYIEWTYVRSTNLCIHTDCLLYCRSWHIHACIKLWQMPFSERLPFKVHRDDPENQSKFVRKKQHKHGFHTRFENRFLDRATCGKLRCPDKKFCLPDIINTKTYNRSFGCPVGKPRVNFWLPDRKKWLPQATRQTVMWNPVNLLPPLTT